MGSKFSRFQNVDIYSFQPRTYCSNLKKLTKALHIQNASIKQTTLKICSERLPVYLIVSLIGIGTTVNFGGGKYSMRTVNLADHEKITKNVAHKPCLMSVVLPGSNAAILLRYK